MSVLLAARPTQADPTAAADWLREAVRPTLSRLLVLHRAVADGGHDPAALRRALDASLRDLHLDEPARALGLRPVDLQRARLALIAAADELTQRPASRCDYSRDPPPGEPALLQQQHLDGTTSAGSHFCDELAAILTTPRPGPADLAVLELYATCLALGVHGRHEPGPELDALRTRAVDRLRPALAPPELPLPPRAPPRPTPRPPTRTLLGLSLLLVLFTAALVLAHRAALTRDADALRRDLRPLAP